MGGAQRTNPERGCQQAALPSRQQENDHELMSVLGHERWLLREAYIRADEALEMLSTELAKDEQHWIADTSHLYKNAPGPKEGISAISSHLATKPIGIFENPGVTRALAQVLYIIHDTGQNLSELNHTAELAIQEVRDISI